MTVLAFWNPYNLRIEVNHRSLTDLRATEHKIQNNPHGPYPNGVSDPAAGQTHPDRRGKHNVNGMHAIRTATLAR